eukprot:TRINITY_DN9064_c0_g1_i1.p1 TRINITY_DN9064_c0_g1~~TRINITY_DN9064_c0_g1_i1.p1  ORF type:complete len:546 (+),score=135.51 TRINITY_DN9064_c0_g1_i1:81-1640(+)
MTQRLSWTNSSILSQSAPIPIGNVQPYYYENDYDYEDFDYVQHSGSPEDSLSTSLSNVDLCELTTSQQVPYVIISTTRQCVKAVSEIMRNYSFVGMDCEGVRLGKDGKLCIIQICTPTKIYFFDVLRGGARLFTERGLRQLLQSEKVVKVIHDCRRDSEALYHQYQLRMQGIYDTQVAYAVLSQFQGYRTPFPVGLNTLLRKFQCAENEYKDEVKVAMATQSDYWETRPLTKLMVDYAACDVHNLMPVYEKVCIDLSDATCGLDSHKLVLEYSLQYSELNLWKNMDAANSTGPTLSPDNSSGSFVGYGISAWDDDIGKGQRDQDSFSPFEFYSKYQYNIIEDIAARRKANRKSNSHLSTSEGMPPPAPVEEVEYDAQGKRRRRRNRKSRDTSGDWTCPSTSEDGSQYGYPVFTSGVMYVSEYTASDSAYEYSQHNSYSECYGTYMAQHAQDTPHESRHYWPSGNTSMFNAIDAPIFVSPTAPIEIPKPEPTEQDRYLAEYPPLGAKIPVQSREVERLAA